MANTTLTQTGQQVQADLDLLDNNNATSGQVLTADGNGGAAWGDVLTASSVTDGTVVKAIGFDSSNNLVKGSVGGGGGSQVFGQLKHINVNLTGNTTSNFAWGISNDGFKSFSCPSSYNSIITDKVYFGHYKPYTFTITTDESAIVVWSEGTQNLTANTPFTITADGRETYGYVIFTSGGLSATLTINFVKD